MAKFRIGFGTDFILKDNKVGIGSTIPREKLDVAGNVKGDFAVSGGAFFNVYSGFTPQIQNVSLASTVGFNTSGIGTFTQVNESETGFLNLIGEYGSLSEDVVVDEGKIFNVSTVENIGITTLGTQEVYTSNDSIVSVGTLESVSIQSHFNVPNGGTSTRTTDPVEGMVRFNDDLNTLEFWNGFEWRQFTVTGASGRGVFGAQTPGNKAQLEFVNISTLGNASNFGTLSLQRFNTNGCSSSIRGVFGGGYNPSGTRVNTIDYITIASEGNAIYFGDLTVARSRPGSASSSTRGLCAGGSGPSSLENVIDYVQISTLGNALDFGDLTQQKRNVGGCSSPTRALFAGGTTGAATSRIEAVTISSKGDAVKFGDLIGAYFLFGGLSNTTRGFWTGNVNVNDIQYVTIASFGNAIDFGDLTVQRGRAGGASNSIRGLWAGGYQNPGTVSQNTIDYITLATTGNAQDFGDLTEAGFESVGISDSHGGLGGF